MADIFFLLIYKDVPKDQRTQAKRVRARSLIHRTVASQGVQRVVSNINLIKVETMSPIPEIKLVRTDTTLDLSQKAEKV